MTTTTIDDCLSPYVRREINDIMDEVHPRDMTLDELLNLLKLMEAVRLRVRAGAVPPNPDRVVELRVVR